MEVMDYFDAHIHFFYQGSLDTLRDVYLDLEGLRGGSMIILEEAPERREQLYMMVPRAYHHMVSEEIWDPAPGFMQWFESLNGLQIIPYLDTRFFEQEQVDRLDTYVGKGYRGVKILYIPEEDTVIGVEGWQRTYQRSVRRSENLMADLIRHSNGLNLPVLFHVDLRRYGDYMDDLLTAYPEVRFNIPHFGSSRKKMAEFMARYPNCYTDFSSLLPFMKESPSAYRDFIVEFSDRVLFGSDATFGWPSMITEYVDFIRDFLEGEVRNRVVKTNFERFHGMKE